MTTSTIEGEPKTPLAGEPAPPVLRSSRRAALEEAVLPAIVALQQQAEELRQAELARSQSKLADLTPEQREAVEALTRSLTAKLLHPQLTALRESTRPKGKE